MMISLIAAMSENRVIGLNQDLPWHLPADLKRFKNIIRGHPLIMGRKTFETIPKPSASSEYVVITRDTTYKHKGVKVVHNISDALSLFKHRNEEIFILGGGDIYNQTVAIADRIYLTIIHKHFDGDTHFPEFDKAKFKVTFEEHHSVPFSFSFIDYERIR